MDWQLPDLRFKHIEQVQAKTGVNLSDLEEVASLDDILKLKPVIEVLSRIPSPEIEASFYGKSIQDAQDQLLDKLKDFFPPQKSQLLGELLEKVKEYYIAMTDSGNTG